MGPVGIFHLFPREEVSDWGWRELALARLPGNHRHYQGTQTDPAHPQPSPAAHQHRPWSWRCSRWHTWWCRWPGRSGRWARRGWQTAAHAARGRAGPGWPHWPLRWPASGAHCHRWPPGRHGRNSPPSGPQASLLRSAAPGTRVSWWWGSPPEARQGRVWGTAGQFLVPSVHEHFHHVPSCSGLGSLIIRPGIKLNHHCGFSYFTTSLYLCEFRCLLILFLVICNNLTTDYFNRNFQYLPIIPPPLKNPWIESSELG